MARTALFDRLPAIWKRLDLPDGLLQRFLGVLDTELNRVHGRTGELLDTRSVDRIADRFLRLLGDIVGHERDYDESYHWNRERIRHAVRRYSYKGTLARIEDAAQEAGADMTVDDRAAHLWVLGRQGRPGHDDCFFIAPDFNVDGAFAYEFRGIDDRERLLKELSTIRPVGEIWWITLFTELAGLFECVAEIPISEAPLGQDPGELGLGAPAWQESVPGYAYTGVGLTWDSALPMSNLYLTWAATQTDQGARQQAPPDFQTITE